MVALDLRKAYDTVTHVAVLEALADAYPGKRLNNFVRSFLANRTFEIRSGRHDTLHFDNRSGVPQGAILSPTLFNLVMTKLVRGVAAIPGVHVTAYADDVTIWTEAADHSSTESAVHSLQQALDTFTSLLPATGMEVSLAKSNFIIIRGRPEERALVALTMGGQTLQRAPERWIRVLGVPIHESGGASEWLRQLKAQWTPLLSLVRRISNTSGGASQNIARRLVQAILVSKASYGALCFRLTKRET